MREGFSGTELAILIASLPPLPSPRTMSPPPLPSPSPPAPGSSTYSYIVHARALLTPHYLSFRDPCSHPPCARAAGPEAGLLVRGTMHACCRLKSRSRPAHNEIHCARSETTPAPSRGDSNAAANGGGESAGVHSYGYGDGGRGGGGHPKAQWDLDSSSRRCGSDGCAALGLELNLHDSDSHYDSSSYTDSDTDSDSDSDDFRAHGGVDVGPGASSQELSAQYAAGFDAAAQFEQL